MKKRILLALACISIICTVIFGAVACNKKETELDIMNGKISEVVAATKTVAGTTVTTQNGDIIYDETATYEKNGEEYLVKYTVKALNDNPMSGETYVETETEETVSVEAYQKAIKANAKFDPSICEDGFGVDTSADGKTTLTFKVSATAKAQTLGLTETEAQSVLNPVISLTRNETRLLNMTISYETTKGNTVVISFDYEYAA